MSTLRVGERNPKKVLESIITMMIFFTRKDLFHCRSVITPDPYLDIDEIGIPEVRS